MAAARELIVFGPQEVRAELTFARCMPAVADAMQALSGGRTSQLPRAILDLVRGDALGVMAGALTPDGAFGAKVLSVSPSDFAKGLSSHQGLVAVFEPESGAPVALVHAGEVTRVRTASVSAVASNALARPGAGALAILGYGEQAHAHVAAHVAARPISVVHVWGRSPARARAPSPTWSRASSISRRGRPPRWRRRWPRPTSCAP